MFRRKHRDSPQAVNETAPSAAATGDSAAPPAPNAAAAPAPAAPPGPTPAEAALEAGMKRLADQVTRLQAGIDGARAESKDVAAKLGGIEEQLRSVLALSEALSNAFNPLAATFRDAAPAPPAPAGPVPARAPAAEAPLPAPSAPPARLPSAREALAMTTDVAPEPPEGHGRALLADVPLDADATLAALAWLDHLGAQAGTPGALRLLDFYQSIGWLAPTAHARLLALLTGLPPREAPAAPPTMDLHATSYAVLERIAAGRPRESPLRLPPATLPRAPGGDGRGR